MIKDSLCSSGSAGVTSSSVIFESLKKKKKVTTDLPTLHATQNTPCDRHMKTVDFLSPFCLVEPVCDLSLEKEFVQYGSYWDLNISLV